MSFRMIQPWVNPRSEFYWFRRRVPKAYRGFGMPAEIKFSLGTKDWDEAVLRCQEENLKLEREWRANLVGTPPTELSHLQIAEHIGVVRDRRYFSRVGNMVWLPTSLKGFTDTLPEIKAMLRVCAFHLYGWACEHDSVAAQAAEVRTGRIPADYPAAWQDGRAPLQLPPGTAPFTTRIEKAIAKRKAKIRADLDNADFLHYPKSGVMEVLKFWKVDLV